MTPAKTIAEKALQCLRLMEEAGLSVHDQAAALAIMNVLLGNKLKQMEIAIQTDARNRQIVDAIPMPSDEVFRQ